MFLVFAFVAVVSLISQFVLLFYSGFVGIVRLRKSGINNPARFKYNIENRTLSKINYI